MKNLNSKRSAGRRLGMILTLLLFAVSMQAAEIVATATGTLRGGDDRNIFFQGRKALDGVPFIVVFRFDESKGAALSVPSCPKSGSGLEGQRQLSPGTAILTINGVSHEFGKAPAARSLAFRSTASSCSESSVHFEVDEGSMGFFNDVVDVTATPKDGKTSFTQNADWRVALAITAIEEWSQHSGYNVSRDTNHYSKSSFAVKSLTVTKE